MADAHPLGAAADGHVCALQVAPGGGAWLSVGTPPRVRPGRWRSRAAGGGGCGCWCFQARAPVGLGGERIPTPWDRSATKDKAPFPKSPFFSNPRRRAARAPGARGRRAGAAGRARGAGVVVRVKVRAATNGRRLESQPLKFPRRRAAVRPPPAAKPCSAWGVHGRMGAEHACSRVSVRCQPRHTRRAGACWCGTCWRGAISGGTRVGFAAQPPRRPRAGQDEGGRPR